MANYYVAFDYCLINTKATKMKFYSAKQVYLEIGISSVTLYSRISKGVYPPFDASPIRKNGVGYFEKKMIQIKSAIVPKNGRPKKL